MKSGDNIFPPQLPHGGIQFEVSLGLFSTEDLAKSKARFVEKVTFENSVTGESYKAKKALIYKFFTSGWYASYNFYLGNSGKVQGDWEVSIHTRDGKKYSGHFTIDGTEVEEAAPIPVEVVTVKESGGYFTVSFPKTNADYYNFRVVDGDNFIYNKRLDPTGSSEISWTIPDPYTVSFLEGKTGRIEARFNADKNPWPSLVGTGSVDCSLIPGQYSVIRSSTYFLLKVLEE